MALPRRFRPPKKNKNKPKDQVRRALVRVETKTARVTLKELDRFTAQMGEAGHSIIIVRKHKAEYYFEVHENAFICQITSRVLFEHPKTLSLQ